MKTFESVLILNPTLTKEEMQQTMKNIMDFIYDNGQGAIENVEEWGLKKLAYPIQKNPHVSSFYREGYYFDIVFRSKDISELKNVYKNEENVIKYIITTKE